MRKFLKKILDFLLLPTTLIRILSVILFAFCLAFLKIALDPLPLHLILLFYPLPLLIPLLSFCTIMICVDKTDRKTLSLLEEISRLKKIEEEQAKLKKLLKGTITGEVIDDMLNPREYLAKEPLPDDILIGTSTPIEIAWYKLFLSGSSAAEKIFEEEAKKRRTKNKFFLKKLSPRKTMIADSPEIVTQKKD